MPSKNWKDIAELFGIGAIVASQINIDSQCSSGRIVRMAGSYTLLKQERLVPKSLTEPAKNNANTVN